MTLAHFNVNKNLFYFTSLDLIYEMPVDGSTLVVVAVDGRTLFSLFPIISRHNDNAVYSSCANGKAVQSKVAAALPKRHLVAVVKTSTEFRLLVLLYSLILINNF